LARLVLYANENVPLAVVEGLRRREVVITSEQFTYANRHRAVLVTHDDDFLRLAEAWAQAGKNYAGLVFIPKHHLAIGECIRRLKLLADVMVSEEMINHIEFL